MLKWTSLIGLFAIANIVAAQTGKAKRNVEVTAAEEKVRDAAGFEAIREIHREMDDDHSGSIDRKETTGFMSEDMNLRSSDRLRREKAFHGDDEAITVDDLWEAWFESDERSWNNEQVLNWIVNVVGIPVNVERLKRMNIDGTILPRLAVHNSTYMTQMLGIKSSVQRQRLRLNALDVVLFGYRGETGRVKDVALALLVLLLTSVIILYVKQRRRARTQLADLSHRMSQLKSMEADLELTQKSFNEERAKRSTCVGVSEDEMMTLKSQLAEAERRLEANTGYGAPLSLQPLLRRTCENELTYIDKQRSECISEMKEAIEMVERLRKKQTSVFTSIKLATGAASASDQVDSKIFALKSRMEKIHGLFRDTQARWQQIEALCGFSILASDELSMHSGASMTIHSSSAGQQASGYSSSSSTSSRTSSNSHHSVDTRKPSTVTQDKVNVVPTSSSSQLAKARSLENKENGVNNVPLAASPTLPKQQSAPVRTEDVSSMSSEVKKRKGLLGLFKKSSSKTSLQSQQSMH